MRIKSLAIGFFSLLFVSGCGGGSGGGSSLGFQTSDFAGKSHYLVSADPPPTYELAEFNADGTGMLIEAMPSDFPSPDEPFTWVVENGELKMTHDGMTISVTLLHDDKANRYYAVRATGPGGSSEGGIFYDQTTGLAQAQQFVVDHGGSATGAPGSGGSGSIEGPSGGYGGVGEPSGGEVMLDESTPPSAECVEACY